MTRPQTETAPARKKDRVEKARNHPAVKQLLRHLNDPQRSLPGDAQDWQPVVKVGRSQDSRQVARSLAYLVGTGSGLYEAAERALMKYGLTMEDVRVCPVSQTVFVAAHRLRIYCSDLCKETGPGSPNAQGFS